MWRRLLLILVLSVGLGLIYAQGIVGHMEINTSIETNNGTVIVTHQTTVHGFHGEGNMMHVMARMGTHPTMPKIPKEFKRKLMERFRRHFGFEMNLPERNFLHEAPRIEKSFLRWNLVIKRIHSSFLKTFLAYRRAFIQWLHYRKLYLKGEVNDEVYLEKSKEFLETAITIAVKRLETIKESNLADNNIDELISQLQELNTKVAEVNDLNTLRSLYKDEIRPALITTDHIIRAYYGTVSLMAMTGAVMKIDVGVHRILVVLQRHGIDINKDKNVQAILSKLEELRSKLIDLRESYASGKISGKEFLERLKELRDEIQRTIMELRSLLRRMLRAKVAVHGRMAVRGGRR